MPASTDPPLRRSRTYAAVVAALAWSLAGCAEDAGSPTGPEAPGTPVTTTAAASAPLVFRMVSAGDTHTCGVTKDGRAWCWGHNFTGQLGDGTTTNRVLPTPVAGGLRFRTVSAGNTSSCGITIDDLAYCWGSGPVGDGNFFATIRSQPVPVVGGHRFATLRVGSGHSCGVTTAGKAYCWGNSDFGQVGNSSRVTRLTPSAVDGRHTWRWVNPGGLHTCGITTDFRAFCWGRNNEGQLGGGTTRPSIGSPVAVSGGLAFRNISAGHFHSCAATTADRAYCWGHGVNGTLGDGTRTTRSQPKPVAGTLRYHNTSSSGDFFSCGLTLGGRGACWGSSVQGNLGDGTTSDRLTPVLLAGDLALDQISAGDIHGCGVTPEGQAWCWGYNFYGELGDGTNVRRLAPVPVAGPI